MTFQEVKELLNNIKWQKRNIISILEELNDLDNTIETLTYSYDKSGIRVKSGKNSSTVENIVLKLEKRREDYSNRVEKLMAVEDRLSAAIEALSPLEQNIIIGHYMRDKTHDRLARECNYCDKQISRIKKKAISKLTKEI